MLGNDSDIKDVCSTMVKSVLDDIKTNGIENMFTIAERVSSKIGDKLDPEKMAKTARRPPHIIGETFIVCSDLYIWYLPYLTQSSL